MNIGSDCKNLSNPQAIYPKNHKGCLYCLFIMLDYDVCLTLIFYHDWLWLLFTLVEWNGCFACLWLMTLNVYNSCIWWLFFMIVHTHKCFWLHNCILILQRICEAFPSYFYLALSIFNFLDISNFLHWVYFGFGSLYFYFGLVYFFVGCFSVDALVIHTIV